MSEEVGLLIVLILTCIFTGVVVSKILRAVIEYVVYNRRKKKYPGLLDCDEKTLCKGPHSYDYITLAMSPLATKEYLVCKDCGFVSTSQAPVQLNAAALEIFKNNLKLREEQKKINDEIRFKRQEIMEKTMETLVKRHLPKFDGDPQKNYEELKQFFRFSLLEIDSAYDKLNKELDEKSKKVV